MLKNSIIANKRNTFSERFQEDMLDLFGQTYVIPDDFTYRIITVSHEHIARPDLISNIVYGSTEYGDLICKINGISNPFELNEGMDLYIPDISNINDFLTPAIPVETINDSDNVKSTVPTYKKPKEKRSANEAIIGDSRFKIDKTNRVIIY